MRKEERRGKGLFKDLFKRGIPFLILIFFPLFLYLPSLNYPFHYDDYSNIVENPYIKNLKNINFFIEGLKKKGTTFRTIPTLTFALNYHFSQLNPSSYRFINLLLHITSGVLIYFISKKLLAEDKQFGEIPNSIISIFISLLFLIHPVQINTVVYIVQRNEGLSSFFILLSLFLFIRLKEKRGRERIYYLIGVVLSVLGAIFSKEIGFMTIGLILLYDLMFTCDKREETSRRLKYYVLFFIPIVVYVFFFLKGGILFLLINGSSDWFWSPIDNLRTQSNVIIQYIKILLFPWPGWLNIDHDFKISKSFFEYPTIFSILLLSFIFFIGIYYFRKKRLISFAIFWFFIILAPTSSLIPLWDIMVEYRLYLPIFSFGLFLSFCIGKGYQILRKFLNFRKSYLIIFLLMMLIISIYSFFNHQRLKIFGSEIDLWEDTIQKSPRKARGYINLGIMLHKRGKLDEALRILQTALYKYPSHHPLAYYNLGLIYSDLGRYEDAINCFMNFLKKNQNDPKVYYEIGHIYLRMGEIEKAESSFKKSIELDPHWGPPYGGLGDILNQKGLNQEAIRKYEMAIKYSPDSAPLYLKKGEILIKIGQEEKALLETEKALQIDPKLSDAYTFLGGVYLKKGENEKAFKNLRKSIELNPKSHEAFNNMGLFYRARGEIDRAIEYYQKAIKLNPNFFDAYINLGEAYGVKKRFQEAIEFYRKAIAINSKGSEAYNNIGVIFLERKNIDEAISYLNKAIQLNPNYGEAYYNLAIAHYYKKDLPKVAQYGKKALTLGYPIDPKLDKILKIMEQKRFNH